MFGNEEFGNPRKGQSLCKAGFSVSLPSSDARATLHCYLLEFCLQFRPRESRPVSTDQESLEAITRAGCGAEVESCSRASGRQISGCSSQPNPNPVKGSALLAL